MTTADKIKALRKAFGFTQTELGERLGVKKNAVSKWECGRVDDIPASKLKAMAKLFQVPVSFIIDDENSEEELNKELLKLLVQLSSDELEKVSCFVQGLISNR